MACEKYRIGVDLGGTNIAAGLLTPAGEFIGKKSIPTNVNRTDVAITEDMAKLCLEIIKENDLSEDEVRSIGIGCPGFCDSKNSILRKTVNLPFHNTNIREIFSGFTKIPVYLGNDANCAALGEYAYGAAKGYEDSITITLGTGVGGGVIMGGKLVTGSNFAGAELGHIVIQSGGELCGCGRKGCLEAYASATALIRDTKKAFKAHPDSVIGKLCGGDSDKIDGKTPFDGAKIGDKYCIEIVENYIKYLGEGIVNFINIFQPEIILLSGGVSKQGEYLLAPLRKFIEERNYCNGVCKSSLLDVARLGNDAGIIGAAILNEQYEEY